MKIERKDFVPRPWQPSSIDFITDVRRGALWMEPGMGKTACGLTAYDQLLTAGYETMPALAIGTKRITEKVWYEEPKKWNHLSNIEVSRLIGDKHERATALRRPASVYAISYDNLPWLIEHLEGKWPFGMIMADESTRLAGLRISVRRHPKTGKQFVAGQGTIRARKLAKWAWRARDGRWLNLSGTPAPNGLKKLYGQIWFQDFGERLGNSYDAFTKEYFKIGYDGFKLEPLPGSDKRINEKLKDICMSVQISDWMDIKKPIDMPILIELPTKARAVYRDMEKELYVQFGEREVEAVNNGTKANKLLQIAGGFLFLDHADDEDRRKPKKWIEIHDEKLRALEGFLEEVGQVPMLIAYQFRPNLERIMKLLPKARDLDSTRTEEDFKKGKFDHLLIHPASGAHGIDGFQHRTNRICFFDQWPDLELRDQVIGRIGPIRQFQAGHNRPVFVHDILAVDTRDIKVYDSHDDKREIQKFFMDAMRR